jgi:hypothetical protein
VALPLKWALVAQTQLPPFPEADVQSFLQVEAERSFPCDVTTLVTATSRSKSSGGEEHVTFVGVPRGHVMALAAALRAAGLKPQGFSLGITALQPPTPETVLAVRIGENHVGLQITHGGGVLGLRSLEGVIENTGGRTELHTDVIARELRITLGQLPESARATLRQVRVFGAPEFAEPLVTELERRFSGAGLVVTHVTRYEIAGLPKETPVSAALSLAVERLSGVSGRWEFLPPQVSRLQEFLSRYGTGKMRKVGLIAGGAVGLVLLAFLVQQIVLWRYQSRWEAMKTKVTALEVTQGKIKQFRPWFDESARSLSILKQVTQAFPEDGMVTAKTVEIHEANQVTCTGTAKDNASLLRTLDKLRQAGNVADLKVNRIQGKSPLQFTFDFRWVEGGASAN